MNNYRYDEFADTDNSVLLTGEAITVPEKMRDGRLNSDALKNSIVVGENTFLR